MPTDKRMHVNEVRDIAAAWESGKPLAALCGVVRRVSPAQHEKRLKAKVIEACPDCVRIAAAMASTGQSNPLGEIKTVAEIKSTAKPPSSWTYTVTSTKFSGDYLAG